MTSDWARHYVDLAEARQLFDGWTPSQRSAMDRFAAFVKDQLVEQWGVALHDNPDVVYAFIAGASTVAGLGLDQEEATLFAAYLALEWMPDADRSRLTDSG